MHIQSPNTIRLIKRAMEELLFQYNSEQSSTIFPVYSNQTEVEISECQQLIEACKFELSKYNDHEK